MPGLTYEQEYHRWISFYSDLISGLDGAARDQLLKADSDSQKSPRPVTNSLLRVLDKVFYTQGGGRGLG